MYKSIAAKVTVDAPRSPRCSRMEVGQRSAPFKKRPVAPLSSSTDTRERCRFVIVAVRPCMYFVAALELNTTLSPIANPLTFLILLLYRGSFPPPRVRGLAKRRRVIIELMINVAIVAESDRLMHILFIEHFRVLDIKRVAEVLSEPDVIRSSSQPRAVELDPLTSVDHDLLY